MLVDWRSFEEEERTWEPIENIWRDAPAFLKDKLRAMRPGVKLRGRLSRKYGIKLLWRSGFSSVRVGWHGWTD